MFLDEARKSLERLLESSIQSEEALEELEGGEVELPRLLITYIRHIPVDLCRKGSNSLNTH